ncbi:hypothetical protein HEP84_55760 [Streptomyces sp. RLB1-33]|nr:MULTISPECIES: hypothetical protein [Streptomyces]
MCPSCLPLLWLYPVCAIAISGIGGLKVLPVCYRFLAEFEPLR